MQANIGDNKLGDTISIIAKTAWLTHNGKIQARLLQFFDQFHGNDHCGTGIGRRIRFIAA